MPGGDLVTILNPDSLTIRPARTNLVCPFLAPQGKGTPTTGRVMCNGHLVVQIGAVPRSD